MKNIFTISNFKKLMLAFSLLTIVYVFQYCWRSFPIISAHSAKTVCSQVFVAGREPNDVLEHELNSFPLYFGSVHVDRKDLSASGSVFGLATRKAIYREGLGCTLVVGMTEQELRNQKIKPYKREPINTEAIPWPMGDKIDAVPAGFNKEKLESAMDHIFDEKNVNPAELKDTHAVVVLYDGKIVAERYAEGLDKNSKHISFSMAKSITNAMVGILVKQGKLKVDEPAPVKQWQNDDRKNIKLSDLMHMSSGLEWDERYDRVGWLTDMMFKHKDTGAFAASAPLEAKPGELFKYSSGTAEIICDIIRQAIGDENYYDFPYKELFNKIGMHSVVMEPDAGGTLVGTSYVFASARDYARFGLLFYQDGQWAGEKILPDGWVTYTTARVKSSGGKYGALWWTNTGGNKDHPSHLNFPNLPADTFVAMGIGGQFIVIVPSKKLVVVRLVHARNKLYRSSAQLRLGMDAFVAELLEGLPQQ
jgi:CubicO group peptidase (beta-lactamase class C family)